MDNNKKLQLEEIGYRIQKTCGNCKWAQLNGEWGTCSKFSYDHEKHSESNRELSINRYGVCGSHELSKSWEFTIHGYKDFM